MIDPADPVRRLALAVAAHLEAAGADDVSAIAGRFAAELRTAAVGPLPLQRRDEKPVRALAQAPIALGAGPEPAVRDLWPHACAAFGLVRWTEFYAEDGWSRGFLHGFANGEGIGPDGRFRHDSLILGLFLLGPGLTYPPHAHPAEEFYLVLSGTPRFQVGADRPYIGRPPGEVIFHHAEVSHAIQTGNEPFFAVFGWRGEIMRPSWYRHDMMDDSEPIRHPSISKG